MCEARAALAAVAYAVVAQVCAPVAPIVNQPDVSQQALDSHYLQRALAHDLPLPEATMHGTHNSFNVNNRTGLFFEVPHNQIYDIDAQLRYLGVRYIELDVHYIPEITAGGDAARAKVCHEDDTRALEIVAACNGEGFRDPSSGQAVPGTAFNWEFCHSAGLYNFSRRTGCNMFAPTLTDELATIRSWLRQPGNGDEIMYIYFEDHISRITAGRPVLQTIVDTSLSSMVFTTDDLIHYRTTTAGAGPDDWPSAAQLVALGKRVVIFNDAEDRSGLEGCDGCKPPLQFQMTAEWGWPNLEGFDGPPSCMGKGSDRSSQALQLLRENAAAAAAAAQGGRGSAGSGAAAATATARTFYRVQGDATGYPVIHQSVDAVQLTGATAQKVMACGMWPQFDLIDEDKAATTRWSFADDESATALLRSPAPEVPKRCAVILGGDDIRWHVMPCHSHNPRRCACRGIEGDGQWHLASPHECLDGDCDDGDGEDCRAACPLHNSVFAAPRTPAEMQGLANAIKAAGVPPRASAEVEETVWLNAIEHCSGCWGFNELEQPTTADKNRLHCLPPVDVAEAPPRHSCFAAVGEVDGGDDCAGDGCASGGWMGLSSNFTTFSVLGIVVAVCVACGYRRSVYLAQHGSSSSSDLKQHLNREQDEGLEMDVFATNTSVSSNVADHPGFMGGSWDLPEGGYTTPAGF